MKPPTSLNVIPTSRKIMLLLAALLALSFWLWGSNFKAHAQDWEVYFKGKPLLLPEGPIERDGTVLVPLRASMEPYGYSIKPLGNGTFRLTGGAIGQVDLKIGEKKAILNDTVERPLKTAPEIINGTMFIDLDLAGELTDIGTEQVAGKPIIELRPGTSGVDYDSQYWYAVQSEGAQGVQFVNKTGQVMLQTDYDRAADFGYSALSAVYRQGKAIGYIDRTGRLAVEASHYQLLGFTEGLARFKELVKGTDEGTQVKYGYLNGTGKVVIPAIYDSVADFSDGLAKVVKDGKTYYINHSGRTVIGVIPNSIHTEPFSEGLASVTIRVKSAGKWTQKAGFINAQGKFVIPPKFDSVGAFSEGLATASFGLKTGYIDRTGKWVIQPQYGNGFAHEFHEGLANVIVLTGPDSYRTDLIDKTGKALKLPIVKDIGNVSEGLIEFSQGDQVGFMNLKGEVVVKPQYSYVEDYHGGAARVHLYIPEQDRYETLLIDRTGKVVWSSEPEKAS